MTFFVPFHFSCIKKKKKQTEPTMDFFFLTGEIDTRVSFYYSNFYFLNHSFLAPLAPHRIPFISYNSKKSIYRYREKVHFGNATVTGKKKVNEITFGSNTGAIIQSFHIKYKLTGSSPFSNVMAIHCISLLNIRLHISITDSIKLKLKFVCICRSKNAKC